MTITQAIKITEDIIKTNNELIEEEDDSDFAEYLINQNKALQILISFTKVVLN